MKWNRNLLAELNLLSNETPILYCDNQSAIAISENDKFRNRTKLIDIRHHFIRDAIKNKEVELRWIESKRQEADLLTKPLSQQLFLDLLRFIVLISSKNLKEFQGERGKGKIPDNLLKTQFDFRLKFFLIIFKRISWGKGKFDPSKIAFGPSSI